MSHQLRTILLKIDKMFFVRVHATRAYDDVANNKNNETISNLKLIQYNLKNKQATPPRLNPPSMYDSYRDGICCSSWGIGEYTVFYDNDITILQKVASLEDLKRQFDSEMDVLTSRHQLLLRPMLCPQSCPLLHPLMCLP